MTQLFKYRIFVCVCVIIVSFSYLSFAASETQAREPVSLKVTPEHVGVFTEIKIQQFKAIAIFSDGSQEDYTNKVGWSLEAYPFANQTMTPDQVATINRNGLATVKSTWGRVWVKATYPPPPIFTPAAINHLLLRKKWFRGLPAILSLLLAGDDDGLLNAKNGLLSGDNSVPITVKDFSNRKIIGFPGLLFNGITATKKLPPAKDQELDVTVQKIKLLPFMRSTSYSVR